MSTDRFQITGNSLTGRGISIDVSALVAPELKVTALERDKQLTVMAEVAYLQGRASVLLSIDDRFDLHSAVASLRALAVISGATPQGDRHGRAADILASLLEKQMEGA